MNNRIVGVIILLVILVGAVVWYGVDKNNKEEQDLNQPELSVSAYNETKNSDAVQVTAQPQDTITYTLKAENPTDEVIPGYVIQADISNLSNASTLIDAGGASYNSANNSLVWTPLDIGPHQSIESRFVVRVNDLSADTSETTLSIKFNNEVVVGVARQQTVAGSSTDGSVTVPKPYSAPTSGTSGMLVLALALISTTGIYLARRKKNSIRA